MAIFNTKNNFVAPERFASLMAGFQPITVGGPLSDQNAAREQRQDGLRAGMTAAVSDSIIRRNDNEAALELQENRLDAQEDAAKKLAAVKLLSGGLGGGDNGLAATQLLKSREGRGPLGTGLATDVNGFNQGLEALRKAGLYRNAFTTGSAAMTSEALKGAPSWKPSA